MSIRARATVVATLIVGIALAVAAFGLLVAQRSSLVRHVDEVADLRGNDIAALARDGALPRRLAAATDDDEKVVVTDADGALVAETPGPGPPLRFVPRGPDAELRTVGHWRVAARTVATGDGMRRVYVAASLDPVDEAIGLLRARLLVASPLLLALVAAMTWWLVGRALRPVEAIRHEVATITETSLERRVPVPATGDEVERLATTMNAMLDQLEDAVERQRRFVADASHELRTPLAALHADLELDGNDAGLRTTMGMERLVNNLLYLARADAAVGTPSPLDLDDVVLEEVRAHRGRVRVDTSAVSGAAVRGRRDDLARVVRNLLDNADRYAASRVTVSLGADDGQATLTVADDGPGIPAADRTRVFERFTRVDDSRGRSSGGSGLGLAIAREIVAAHGGSIAATDAGIVVQLPTA